MPGWESEPRKIIRVVRICFVWVPVLMKAFDLMCHGNTTAVNLGNGTWAIVHVLFDKMVVLVSKLYVELVPRRTEKGMEEDKSAEKSDLSFPST